jgi:glucose/mannose transport system substrate-binding protein
VKLRLAVAALLAAGAAATAAPPESAPAKGASLTFYHWWTSPSESAALNSLVDVFKRRYPDVSVNGTLAPHGGGGRMFSIIRAAASSEHPPDAFQMHAGSTLRPFVDAELVAPVDAIWASQGLEKVTPKLIQTMNKIGEHYYSIPVDVHRTNLIWYNKALLERNGIDPHSLTTWDSFFKAAEKLQAAGVKQPIQLGVTWTAVHLFECIMASLGMEPYQDWINGQITKPDDPHLTSAFTILARYLAYANKDHGTTEWDAALKRVMKGEGAFCAMGDWANGEFRVAGQTFGKDYAAIPVPGTGGSYGVTVDAFAQTRRIAGAASSERWLKVVASRNGQDAFNSLKGSVSPRTDADPSKYDPYQKSAIADLKAARFLYPSVGAATHDAFKAQLDEIVGTFEVDLDVKKAAAAVATAAARSDKKFIRVWSLK